MTSKAPLAIGFSVYSSPYILHWLSSGTYSLSFGQIHWSETLFEIHSFTFDSIRDQGASSLFVCQDAHFVCLVSQSSQTNYSIYLMYVILPYWVCSWSWMETETAWKKLAYFWRLEWLMAVWLFTVQIEARHNYLRLAFWTYLLLFNQLLCLYLKRLAGLADEDCLS